MSKIKLLTIIISFLTFNKAICMEEDCKRSTEMPFAQSLLSSGKLTLKSHAQIKSFVEDQAIRIEIVNIKHKQREKEKNVLLKSFDALIKNAIDMAFDACEYIIEVQLKHNFENKKQISDLIKSEVTACMKFNKDYIKLNVNQKKQLNDFIDQLIEQKIQAILQKK